MQQRRFHRITCDVPGELDHHGITYRIRVKNISLGGALIGSDDMIIVPVEESCTLALVFEDGAPAIAINAQVVHCFFSMVGVKFTGFAEGAEERLFELLQKMTPAPENLAHEWKDILGH